MATITCGRHIKHGNPRGEITIVHLDSRSLISTNVVIAFINVCVQLIGHNYSMPETSHQYASHTSDTENLKAAHTDNTLFGSVSNCPASVQDDLPSGISTRE